MAGGSASATAPQSAAGPEERVEAWSAAVPVLPCSEAGAAACAESACSAGCVCPSLPAAPLGRSLEDGTACAGVTPAPFP